MNQTSASRTPRIRDLVVTTVAVIAVGAVPLACGGSSGASAEIRAKADRASGRIVFQRFDPRISKVRVYTIRPDGTRLRAITRPPANADEDVQPKFSPDGSRIIFHRLAYDGTPDDLIVVNADGSNPHNVTQANCTGDCLGSEQPAWSPDGQQIVFSRAIGPVPADGPPPVVGLFVSDADGSKLRQLTQLVPNSGTEDHTPSWSPDGERIAFMRANNTAQPENASYIYTVDADGGDPTLVRRMPRKRPGSGVPDWSPSGRRILFDTYCLFGDCGQPPTGSQLFTIRPDGKDLRRLTDIRGNSYDGAWSPNGRKIVFSRNPKVSPLGDLFVMRRNGTHVRRLTHAPRRDNHNADWGR